MCARKILSLEVNLRTTIEDTQARGRFSAMSVGTNSDIKVIDLFMTFIFIIFKKIVPGDRTKHLKNLHGIHKSLETTSQSLSSTTSTVTNGNIEMYSPASSQSQGPSPPASLADKTPFLPSITEETCSSISSFQSNPEMSDAASASGSIIGESPNKFDPLDVGLPVSQQTSIPSTTVSRPTISVSLPTNGLTFSQPQETVTMSIEEVIQYAQPIADFTF